MNRNATAQGCIVLDTHVTTKHNGIGHNDSVLNDTIVSHV
jgi:hypothetical protein